MGRSALAGGAKATDPPATPTARFRDAAVRFTNDRRPDLDSLSVALSFTLTRVASAHQQESERLVHRLRGWTYSGFRVLYMIWLFEPLEARDLARYTGVSRQTTSTVLRTLEAADLIARRRTSKTDRRLVEVRLTPTGREQIEAAFGEQNAVERDWFGALSRDEVRQLLALLDRVLLRISPKG